VTLPLSQKQAKDLLSEAARSKNKYRARKITIDGITFDSAAEARRWSQLRLMQRAGEITCLRRQVAYVLAPAVRYAQAKRGTPALRYIADFQYETKTGETITEDVKGVLTEGFGIKRHLMLAVHGIDVQLVRAA
jgi:hypothetical protein